MIKLDQIELHQGDFHLQQLCLDIPKGCYAVLMGKSGCGKTTLLEILAGLRPVQAGSIWLDHQEVTHLKPAARQLGYVPQDRALFPTMRVGEQLGFSLRLRPLSREEISKRVNEMARWLNLEHLMERLPQSLSGGEAQRVALGRALASRPGILCLDEPLSGLDQDLHDEACSLLESIHQETGMTILHVTHSRHEADRLANRLWVIDEGQVRPSA